MPTNRQVFENPKHQRVVIVFSAALNGLQEDEVNKKNDTRRSRQTQFVSSKLITVCYHTADIHNAIAQHNKIGLFAGLTVFK